MCTFFNKKWHNWPKQLSRKHNIHCKYCSPLYIQPGMKELSVNTSFAAKRRVVGGRRVIVGLIVSQAESGAVGSSMVFLLRLHKARKWFSQPKEVSIALLSLYCCTVGNQGHTRFTRKRTAFLGIIWKANEWDTCHAAYGKEAKPPQHIALKRTQLLLSLEHLQM